MNQVPLETLLSYKKFYEEAEGYNSLIPNIRNFHRNMVSILNEVISFREKELKGDR
jgi:hypothetical protein